MRPVVPYEAVKAPKPKRTFATVKKVNASRKGHRFPKNVNEPLRAFVRGLPCLIAGLVNGDSGMAHRCVPPIVVAHISTRGAGAPDDENVIPLCILAHLEQEGWTKRFERRYGVRLKAAARRITTAFYKTYPGERKARAQRESETC